MQNPYIQTGMTLANFQPVAATSVAPPSTALGLRIDPNPARGAARLRFTLPQGGLVRLCLFDVSGRELQRIVDAELPAGDHEAWLGAGRAPGVYLVRLAAGGAVRTRWWVHLN
jgi:hypothetical protein